MPRPERPLEEGDPALTRFVSDLRALRERCGQPGYRVLAKRAHYSATTLSDAAGGRRLPSLAVTLAYVHACGGDTTEWENRWHTLAAHLAASDTTSDPAPPDIAVTAPYIGLAAFQPTDADRFFGRTAITDTLVERVRTERFVTVFGASGAGKSSILRAGLIARIINNTNTPPVVLLTPGPHPIEECAVALAPLTGESVTTLKTALSTDPDGLHLYIRQALIGHPSEVDLILVIDQFDSRWRRLSAGSLGRRRSWHSVRMDVSW
jgi:Helix-turn-helix domain